VGEDHRVYRIRVEQHRAVGRGGEPDAHVHGGDLRREQHAHLDQHPPLAGAHVEDARMADHPRVREDHQRAQDEPHEGQAERRGVGEADLDRDRVRAPQRGQEQGGRGAAPVEGPEGRH
jgi:hypothetical protein